MHSLEPESGSLHGYFSADQAPALTIGPGETVRFRTLEAGWVTERRAGRGPDDLPRAPGWEPGIGHALTGPVAVRGARPGMALSVRVDEVVPGSWGVCLAGTPSRCGPFSG